MASANRQKQPTKRGGPPNAGGRQSAWTGARASPTFSPSNTPARLPSTPTSAAQGTPTNGAKAQDNAQDKQLQQISGLTGTTITLRTRTALHYEGVVLSTNGEGNTTGVTLKDVKDLGNPTAAPKDTLFIASTNIESWMSGPADAKAPDTFRTDTDISGKPKPGRERELQAWQPASDTTSNGLTGDDLTFGAGSNKISWDQFAANESMFGVTTNFDEDAYTTKIDRSAPDFKERERKAQKLANEINGTVTSNSHLAEERNQAVDDSGINEEDKYGAVIRGANSYVPPGARPKPFASAAGTKSTPSDVPKVSVNAPDGAVVAADTPTAKATTPAPAKAPPADPLPAFREFVSNEKQRLTQKRQAMAKNDMDKRMADLIKFSQSFKLNKPIPDDLVPILAKDKDKQNEIREKTSKDAASQGARSIGAHSVLTPSPSNASRSPAQPQPPATAKPGPETQTRKATVIASKTPSAVPSKAGPAGKADVKKPGVFIQDIPPFKGPKTATRAGTSSPKTDVPLSPTSGVNRLNVNASSFRPGPKQSSSNASVTSGSPKTKPVDNSSSAPNPFFGTRPLKKNIVNIKDDFNPFKNGKTVLKASEISNNWGYTGKRYASAFPPIPHQNIPHQSPLMQPPPPPMQPPPGYDEDAAAQAAARGGYVYAYPYGYPGQPMMPGMPPPGFIPGYMQPMHYPPGMAPPPNGQPMYAPAMGQMPPPGAYLGPPPPNGFVPPPNGAGPRPGMPGPSPSHAPHPYYHQSPQMPHAMPYMMMQPAPPQGGFENLQQQQQQQGGGQMGGGHT